MFDAQIYIQRRNQLKKQFQSGLLLFIGNEDSGMSYADNIYRFRQDSTFLYYFGLDMPHLAAIIDIENDKEIIFGDNISLDDLVWFGPIDSMEDNAAKVGVKEVKPFNQINDYLKTNQNIHYLPPYRPEHFLKINEWLGIPLNQIKSNVSHTFIMSVVNMRSYKQPEEIVEIDKAVDISCEMHQAFMQLTKPGVTEAFVAGKLYGIALGHGGDTSYPVILTSHGETLHVHYKNVELPDGRLALCDAGAETELHYAGDLTRTIPINKKFTQKQKEVYQVVLDTQKTAITHTVKGNKYIDVHSIACKSILAGLKEIGIVKGDIEEAFANDVHTLFLQHGLGHMMGLDVHDMENLGEINVGYTENIHKSTKFGWKSLRMARELEPGFVVTSEPGIYFIPTMIDEWYSTKKATDFVNFDLLLKYKDFGGIRIEDNILITNDNNRILGNNMPLKEVEEIEAYQAQF